MHHGVHCLGLLIFVGQHTDLYIYMCVITTITNKEIKLNKGMSMRFWTKYFVLQTSNHIAKVLCTSRFMLTSWSCTGMSIVSSAFLLRLRNEQSAKYCCYFGVISFLLCLLTNEGSIQKGGGSRANIPSREQFYQKAKKSGSGSPNS